MDFLDDEAGASQDSNVLAPSSQSEIASSGRGRAAKRRRLNGSFTSSPDKPTSQTGDYDLPSDDNNGNDGAFENPKSKYDNYMHVPTHVDGQDDLFMTQVDQPFSSPTAIRGPRWRKKSPTPSPTRLPIQIAPTQRPSVGRPRAVQAGVIRPAAADEFDDDDADMLDALMAQQDSENLLSTGSTSLGTMNAKSQPGLNRQPSKSLRQTTLFGKNTTQKTPPRATQVRSHNWPMSNKNEAPTHHSVDINAMKTWTYPLNVGSIRDYQYNIVHRALLHNILVALPTGLGKTFIAATVMLNFYNWTRDAQIVFVAPTKPLVTQQVDACFHIAGIPRSQTTLLTGEISPAIRAEEWQEKRVFFMTPQTLINDLKTGMADPKKIVLLVVDEAHRATGNYAYVEVVRFLRRFNSSFRVLALTATPGGTVEAVQKVVDGLDIARVEIRTEDSLDIRAYVHSRNTETQIFDNSEEIDMCLDFFASAVRPVLNKVNSLNAYYSNDPKTMTVFGLLKGREQWAKSDAGRQADWGLKSMVNACFKPLMSLAHALELLKFHGIGPFYHKIKTFQDEAGGGKYVKLILESDEFKKMTNHLRAWINKDDFVGHPKLSYLNEVVLNHFMDAGDGVGRAGGRPPSDTRIMIFAHYRDSAEEISRVLNRHEPMVRAHVFVGQAASKGSEGMDQKTQIEIIKKFKAGTYNTLVATSIGEEGLDIGEVDLIVCYDCSKSPIRMLQRMGRTGRKRAGNIVVLLMRGKEERDYHSAKDNYLKMQQIIEDGSHFQFHDDRSPRIVPRDIQPVVDKRVVDIPIENTQPGALEPRKRKLKAKRPAKKFHMPDGVETGFQFLGGKKKKTPTTKQGMISSKEADTDSASKLAPLVDDTVATLPPLTNVVLTVEEERDLDTRYAQVAGTDTIYVQPVSLDAHPDRLRKLEQTKYVTHSRTTKLLVQASGAIRSTSREWTRPDCSNSISPPSTAPSLTNQMTKPRGATHQVSRRSNVNLSRAKRTDPNSINEQSEPDSENDSSMENHEQEDAELNASDNDDDHDVSPYPKKNNYDLAKRILAQIRSNRQDLNKSQSGVRRKGEYGAQTARNAKSGRVITRCTMKGGNDDSGSSNSEIDDDDDGNSTKLSERLASNRRRSKAVNNQQSQTESVIQLNSTQGDQDDDIPAISAIFTSTTAKICPTLDREAGGGDKTSTRARTVRRNVIPSSQSPSPSPTSSASSHSIALSPLPSSSSSPPTRWPESKRKASLVLISVPASKTVQTGTSMNTSTPAPVKAKARPRNRGRKIISDEDDEND